VGLQRKEILFQVGREDQIEFETKQQKLLKVLFDRFWINLQVLQVDSFNLL
jgi:hypothetical protein